MPYQSIDAIQNMLSETVFSHTASSKKAAGRALGTIVEIISFYLIKAWGHEHKTAIEKPLPEYANREIMHNVEFTFHRSKYIGSIDVPSSGNISSTKIFNLANLQTPFRKVTSRNLIEKGILKNACTVAESDFSFCNAYFSTDKNSILIYELSKAPYAMFECKRVGIEEGMTKGPQTIEKAKQGAYVARNVSSIQRIRLSDGRVGGAIELDGNVDFFDDYTSLVETAIFEHKTKMLKNFILTVGIVSNHGNWFTSDDHNKEMKVLAQSYDWLLFLTDKGLASFVQDIIHNDAAYKIVKDAFNKNYAKVKGEKTSFTKTNMDYESDTILTRYFVENLKTIESWFNVIAPAGRNIDELNAMLTELHKMEV